MPINIFKFLYVKLLIIINKVIVKLNLDYINFNSYIERCIQNLLKNYFTDSIKLLNENKFSDKSKNSEIIWLFWWQGKNNMPPIVKSCIKSVRHYSFKHKVILIDKYNVKKYTDIPKYIYDKLNNGNITLTHFSDILRFNLLKNYGGLWMDATMYCSSKINSNCFSDFYTSGGYKNTNPKFVNGRWTGFLIGGKSDNSLFHFMNNYFNLYWKYNDYQLDYFLIDQGLYYAYYHNIGNFREYVNRFAINNNPNLFKLVDYLDNNYDKYIYHNITANTNLFKLTYKKNFDRNRNNSFYDVLINKYL